MKKIVVIIIILTLVISSYFLIERIVRMISNNISGIDFPRVEWLLESKKINIPATQKTWSFRKMDGNWYTKPFSSIDPKEILKINISDEKLSFHSNVVLSDASVEVRNDADQIILEQRLQNSSIPVIKEEGIYHYRVKMNWNQPDTSYKGTFTYQFDLVIDLPLAFDFSKLSVTQGEVIKIYVYNANEEDVPVLKQTLFEQFQFYKDGPVYVGSLPTGYLTMPGKYEFEYGTQGGQLFKETITINARDFRVQQLIIDKKIDSSTRNDAANEEYDKYFKPTFLSSGDEIYYSEAFVKPALGRISTEYGQTRHVNGSPTSYHHSGLDIAAPTGTKVKAVNNGKVVLSMFLTLTGNTVVLDHGQGLFSVYYHLHERFVEQGDMVERGQQIGIIGTTGFSTGPHLHFAMSYYNLFIEPGYFLVGEPITGENYKNR
jgi:murein DD-endopeptidase MepM/ murein hydrolase activator NlpD